MTAPMNPLDPGRPGSFGTAPSVTQEIPAVGRQVRTEGNVAADHTHDGFAPDGYPHGAHRADPGGATTTTGTTTASTATRATGATATTGRPDVEGASVGELLGEVTRDLSTLMRQELELAKAELTAEAKKAGQGAGLLGAAGFAGYMVLLFGSLAAMWGLSYAIGPGWGGLTIAVLWAIIGTVAFVLGRTKFREVHPKPERTVDTLQQVPGALTPH